MLNKTVFTFGTLYEPQIMGSLLGSTPPNFEATLTGFSIYQSGQEHLPEIVKQQLGKIYDLEQFKYLFAKPNPSLPDAKVEGKAYVINDTQELILDSWEWYPLWYRKVGVKVADENGVEYKAFIYTLDHDGELLENYQRVVNNLEEMIKSAQNRRKRVLNQFSLPL